MMGNKRIREVDRDYHCSIIGTCLSLDEVRSLLQKSYDEEFSECSDYMLHGIAVKGAGEQSRLSNRITEKLNAKYRTDVYESSKITNCIELEAFWRKSFIEGNVAGPYWAVLSHPDCDDSLRDIVFGEVHMLSHLAGKEERNNLAEMKRKDKCIADLQLQISELRSKLSESNNKNKSLRKENRNIKIELESNEKLTSEKGSDQFKLSCKLEKYKLKLGVYEKRNESLQQRIFSLLEELNFQKEHCEVIHSIKPEVRADSCGQDVVELPPDLEGQKVLLVGGRPSMVPHCKAVVETMNGRFLHHDGGKEQSRSALHDLAVSADIVICALDCVSHDASRCVKRMCGDSQQVIMMKNSGLSSFARELKKAV